MRFHTAPNRYICSVISEMRDNIKIIQDDPTHDPSVKVAIRTIASLVEEFQTLANRMEAAIEDVGDVEDLHRTIKDMRRKIKKLRAEHAKLAGEKEDGSDLY